MLGSRPFWEHTPAGFQGDLRRVPPSEQHPDDAAMRNVERYVPHPRRLALSQGVRTRPLVTGTRERSVDLLPAQPLLTERGSDRAIAGQAPARLILDDLAREACVVDQPDPFEVVQRPLDVGLREPDPGEPEPQFCATAPPDPEQAQRAVLRGPVRPGRGSPGNGLAGIRGSVPTPVARGRWDR
jgi:hypothetical protein